MNKEKAYDIIDVMQEIAASHKASVATIALAWMLRKKGITSIIIGAKKEEQLRENIAATSLILTADEMSGLDAVSELSKEYPGWMIERQADGRSPNKA